MRRPRYTWSCEPQTGTSNVPDRKFAAVGYAIGMAGLFLVRGHLPNLPSVQPG